MTEHISQKRKIVSKTGTEVFIYTIEYAGKSVYKLINPTISPDNYLVYIHGGPNLSCVSLIDSTIKGDFRSLESLLKYTNIILVEQKDTILLEDVKIDSSDIANAECTVQNILNELGPDNQAEVYISVIRKFLVGKKFGIFAQSFGTQILFSILQKTKINELNFEYLALGSPFLGVDSSNVFVSSRRSVLKERTRKLSHILKFSRQLQTVQKRLDNLGLDKLSWHKLALTISHPAQPLGIIEKSLEAELAQLCSMNDKSFISYFNHDEADVINFIIGSQYFTPGENIYKGTVRAMEEDSFPSWMPDECIWLKHVFENQYKDTSLLKRNSCKNLNFHNHIDKLLETANSIPVFMFFDPNDVAVPVQYFIKHQLPIIDGHVKIEFREGYGHWVGHSIVNHHIGCLS